MTCPCAKTAGDHGKPEYWVECTPEEWDAQMSHRREILIKPVRLVRAVTFDEWSALYMAWRKAELALPAGVRFGGWKHAIG